MSLEDDRKLLQAVREYLPPKELHPIAMTAWNLYEGNGNTFPPEAVGGVRAVLDGYRGDLKSLGEAIFGVARFMIYVTEDLGDAATGEKVADLLREYGSLYEPFWEKVGEAAANVGGEASSVFQTFAGEEAKKAAPVFGQAAPQGTVPLRNLVPPGRPPPPPARPPPWKKK